MLEGRLPTSGKTPSFQHANVRSIRARAVLLRILIPRAQRLLTCISRLTASFVGIPSAFPPLWRYIPESEYVLRVVGGRKREHFLVKKWV